MTRWRLRARVAALSLGVLAATLHCAETAHDADPANLARAEAALDAFYSWDGEALAEQLGAAEGNQAALYYQRWAEAAHYVIEERRPCTTTARATIECAITVRDDFGSALGYMATDTFAFEFESEAGDAALNRIEFEGDDPPVFIALFAWIRFYRPEVLTGPCHNMFEGGATPADCSRAVAASASDFAAWSVFGDGQDDAMGGGGLR